MTINTVSQLLQQNRESLDALYSQKALLIAEFLRLGGTVEALAQVDKVAAIRLYREQNGCDLESARKYVDTCTRY